MDTPQLSPTDLVGFDPSRYDACFGPAADGGYWTIGFADARRAAAAIRGVPMSTAHTGAAQLRRLRELGLRVQILDTLDDVDTIDTAVAVAELAPHTAFAAALRPRRPGRLMEAGALAPYEHALRGAGPLGLRTEDGRLLTLDVARWLGAADAADRTVLDRCRGPVLDVGCGPGRLVRELNARGMAALGVDIAETAVALTRGAGFPALLRSVFADLPGEGRWPTVLLIDGNIGIGGDPYRLLARIGRLLANDGPADRRDAPRPGRARHPRGPLQRGRPAGGPVLRLGPCRRSRPWSSTRRTPVTRWSSAGRRTAARSCGSSGRGSPGGT